MMGYSQTDSFRQLVVLVVFLVQLQGYSSDILYPWGSSVSDQVTCSSDVAGTYTPDKPFEFTATRGLPFFGTTYSKFYVSPNGFISDIAADGLIPANARKRFPLQSSTWTNCDVANDPNCWLNYYYDSSVWSPLVASQNDGDVCVNGKNITDNFAYDTSVWNIGSQGAYPIITDPGGCIQNTNPVNYPNWMIAAYWREMEVTAVPATLQLRETTDSTLLALAKADIETLSTVSSFNPQWAYVITWSNLTYPQGFTYPNVATNTFQLVIATDGTDTYGIYNYNQTQIGGGTVGFDSGDGTNYCSFVSSRTTAIRYVATRSNIGNNGRWVIPFSTSFDKTLCEPLRTDSLSCECDDGWEGRLCATSINDCTSTSCPSYADCIDGHMNFTCNYCARTYCKNGGNCLSGESAYTCNCTGNYTGDLCELCGTLICLNNAECAYNTETHQNYCNCASGYSGTLCEEPVVESSKLSTGAIAGLSVGLSLLILIIVGSIILIIVLKKKKNDEVEPYNPEEPKTAAIPDVSS